MQKIREFWWVLALLAILVLSQNTYQTINGIQPKLIGSWVYIGSGQINFICPTPNGTSLNQIDGCYYFYSQFDSSSSCGQSPSSQQCLDDLTSGRINAPLFAYLLSGGGTLVGNHNQNTQDYIYYFTLHYIGDGICTNVPSKNCQTDLQDCGPCNPNTTLPNSSSNGTSSSTLVYSSSTTIPFSNGTNYVCTQYCQYGFTPPCGPCNPAPTRTSVPNNYLYVVLGVIIIGIVWYVFKKQDKKR